MSGRPRRPRPGRRRAAVLAAAALLPALLAGCSGDDGPPGGTSRAAQAVASVPRDRLEEGGTVRWAVDAVPATLNAYQQGADAVTDQVAAAVLPTLFTVDAEGRPQPNPDYLRSAEVTEREPRQTVVYTLAPDARWNDGDRITADDFVAQWKALNGEDNAYWSARNAGYDRVAKVGKGPGRHQVKVVFERPYADWESLFSPLYPQEVTADPDDFNDGARTRLKVSGGPFRVKALDEEDGTVTLVRDETWWGDRALLDEIVFTAVPRDERRAALRDGDLDVAEIDAADAARVTAARATPVPADGAGGDPPADAGPGPLQALDALGRARLAGEGEAAATRVYARALEDAARARERALATRDEAALARLRGYTVHRAYAPRVTQLALNATSDALADERVRWAVARAVDRAELAEAVHRPAGLPVRALGSHLRTLGQRGYHDHSAELGDTGADAAVALLEEAGWHRDGDAGGADAKAAAGDAVRTKDGEPLELRFVLPDGPDARQLRKTGRAIASMLAAVGVRALIETVDAEAYFEEHIAPGAFDLALYSWPATPYPATDARPLYAKPRALPGGGLVVGQNYARIGTDHIDQLLDQAAGELDEAEYDRLLDEADARLWAVAGAVPLFQPPQLVAARSSLANVGAFGLATPRWQDIGHR